MNGVNEVSRILSQIPIEVWQKIVEEEPEWKNMREFLGSYGFGRFAVLMTVTGLNDFQLKGKAEIAYWPKIRELLRSYKPPENPAELEQILSEFYSKERLQDLKLRRLNRFLSSRLAELMWNSDPRSVARDFIRIWYGLSATMNQSRNAKTITFAMKCLGIALLMAGEITFDFEKISIPVDYRIREFTKRLNVAVKNDNDVQRFWKKVLERLKEDGLGINMIHLDSLIWQIGVLSKQEIIEYFSKHGLREVGENLAEVIK